MSQREFLPHAEYINFRQWLMNKASEESSAHLFTSRYANVGLPLTYLLEVYEAGLERKVPEAWVPLYKQMKQEQSEEYETYLMLHEKYGEKHKVFEITIEKSFHKDEDDRIEQKDTKVSTSKKRAVGGRQIKKDGDVHSFN